MGCCGKLRQSLGSVQRPAQTGGPAPRRRLKVVFTYTGSTGMTVRGPVSGRRYRFEHPGVRLVVDPRDRPGLVRVPNLRQVD